MKFRVMTYNIQHCADYNKRATDIYGNIIDYKNTAVPVLKANPDILGLNEVRCGNTEEYADQPKLLSDIIGGEPFFAKAISFGEGMDYGNAVISKFPYKIKKVIPIPDPDPKRYDDYYETRCIAYSEISVYGKDIAVISVHFGLNPDEQENAVNAVLKAAESTALPLIIMGDMNMTPDDPIIKPLFENFESVIDTVDYGATFPSDAPEILIDYIFYKDVKLLSAKKIPGIHSDHLPVTAEFEI